MPTYAKEERTIRDKRLASTAKLANTALLEQALVVTAVKTAGHHQGLHNAVPMMDTLTWEQA